MFFASWAWSRANNECSCKVNVIKKICEAFLLSRDSNMFQINIHENCSLSPALVDLYKQTTADVVDGNCAIQMHKT